MYPVNKNDIICASIEQKIKDNAKLIAKLVEQLLIIVETDELIKLNYLLLTSIRGIGMVNALMTVAYTENFESFKMPEAMRFMLGWCHLNTAQVQA